MTDAAFEARQGAAGTITWNVFANTIRIEHFVFFTDSITTIKEY